MAPFYIKHDDRVEAQTVREWLYEYESSQGKPVWPSSWGDNVKEGYLVVPADYQPEFKGEAKTQHKPRIRVRL